MTRLRNDLYCVEWDVKLYYIISYHTRLDDILTLLVGNRKGIRSVKKTECWIVGDDILTGALHDLYLQLSPLITSIILSYNKIQNGDVLVQLTQVHLENGR